MKIKDLPKPVRNFLWKYLWFRPAIIYAYSCIDPITGLREWWSYVGQTRQELEARNNQHMGYDPRQLRQPWSDLYPEIRIVWQGKCSNFILNLIEEYYIKKHKVVYNYIHNTKNPRRIPKYAAEKQRQERDLRQISQHGRV